MKDLYLECFDAQPTKEHGPLGPLHTGTIRINPENLDKWIAEIEYDYPLVMRVELRDNTRKWNRVDGKLVEWNAARAIRR